EPEIVPLQSLGIVDIDGQDISSSELMAHALSNTCSRSAPEDFRIHRGSAFINEYARVDPKTGLRNDGGPGNANHLLGNLMIASQEETKNVRFSNPAVRALREELSAVRTRVKGTDESRQSVRSKIWGMNLLFNPPSLWVTINPADTQDPIAQVFAGAEIDLNVFCNTAGPDHKERSRNIATDPLASAQYFHFIIKCVIEVLFGIKKRKEGQFNREYGVLGKVQSYIGTVEAQGRG
ncbi:hypothetical protein HYPSUDRAFT_104732, partial [Hypholoma sublateritium FD-334 SS-4]